MMHISKCESCKIVCQGTKCLNFIESVQRGKVMRLVLHIGNHKTGSTAIQTALSNSYKHLVSNGILYPKAGRARNAHHNLVLSQTKKYSAPQI